MNLLFALLKNANAATQEKLSAVRSRGTMGEVWALMRQQAEAGDFDKADILKKTGINSSHLDKITSELLSKCYIAMYGDDSAGLLDFLSSRVQLIRLFYNELGKQLKMISLKSPEEQVIFVKKIFDMIHTNMPMIYRDRNASERLAKIYISQHKGEAKKEAVFAMNCVLLFEKMESLFAAHEVQQLRREMADEIAALGEPLPHYSEEVLYDYYRLRMYYYHAFEDFVPGLAIAEQALKDISRYNNPGTEMNILRIDLKINEFLYYLSRFDEAFEHYHQVMNSDKADIIPDRPYHKTKYMQLCMITGHLSIAGEILHKLIAEKDGRVDELMLPRDIVTYVKYCLLTGAYDTAFHFIQLGFEKNPKAKYFQYEIELRNLQTAYFYLTGQEDIAMDMCKKHIKFLRNNNYTTLNSDYPLYYVVVKAIFDKRGSGPLSTRHQKMYDDYQKSSYAIYGILLKKMMHS